MITVSAKRYPGRPVVLIAAFLLSGSCAATHNPACSPDQLRVIEQAYIAEVMASCLPYKTRASCPEYAAIDLKYQNLRDDWVRCQP